MSRLDTLFRKFMQGSCTQQEKQELFALIAKPEHDAALHRLLDEVIADTDEEKEVDAARAQEILSIILKAGAPPRKRPALLRTLGKVAAAAAVLGLAFATFHYFNAAPPAAQPQRSAIVQDIPAAVSGAVLTLGDGRKVPLDSLGQGIIAQQGGATVTLAKGALAYNDHDAAEVTYNTLNTPRGRVFRVVLPDGSTVWLNAASTLRYPTSFNQHDRTVELSGEAYFDIQPQAGKPFKVKVGSHTEVLVLGTGFNVSAYQNDALVATTLLHGKVSVNRQLLQPGEQAQLANGSPTLKIMKADTSQVMAWKNGMFNFDNADIREVMKQLERWYDIDVQYENGIPPLRFGGKIERGLSLQHITRILAISNVHCRLEGRKLIVTQ
ncbi:FecR family protein [Chitinophaga lutea]|uniref:FecR family protein n=1 Tax=Chitinophaga lutea TaxID=2488634 RepID=A0A3N4PLY6_9BACT|nr:FecR family protein [Chitinophaga lutea]RPE08805.1 FecR family protein [Chitinophaga lutea]